MHRRTTVLSAVTGLLVAAFVAFAASLAVDAAEARSCRGVSLQVPRNVVEAGERLRVAGYACQRDGRRIKVLRLWYRSAGKLRPLAVTRTRRSGRYVRSIVVPADSGPKARISVGRRQTKKRTRTLVVRNSLRPLTGVTSEDSVGTRSSTGGPLPGEGSGPPVKLPNPDPPLDPESPCSLNSPEEEVDPVLEGCTLIASDTASDSNPVPFWGKIDCVDPSQHRVFTGAADGYPTADGGAGAAGYRRLTVFDGDDIWGRRCELGWNNHLNGPTAFYREGQRRVTFASIRLPENFHIDSKRWQTVFQMKQAQPSSNGGNGPIIEMQVMRNRWEIVNDWDEIWSFPAKPGVWTRFAFDIYYSRDPNKGRLQVSVDLNGDGDFDDADERSPKLQVPTLKRETAPGIPGSGLAPGDSIPSHLRAGIYQHPEISCPRPIGCSTEIANVQVLAPAL